MAPRGLRRADWTTPRRGASSMATSLKDIPGANRARKPRRSERGLWSPSRSSKLDLTPSSLRLNRPRKRGGPGALRQIDLFLLVLVLGAVGVVLWLGMAFWGATRVQVAATGIDDGRALTPEVASDLDITIALDSSDELFRSNLKVDGVPLLEDLEPEADGRSVRIRPADLVETELVEQALAEGEHTIELSVGPHVPRRLDLQVDLRRRQHRSHARPADQPRSRADRRPGVRHAARSRRAPSSASAARRSTSTTAASRSSSTPLPLVPSSSRPSTKPATPRPRTSWCPSSTRTARVPSTSAARPGPTTSSTPASWT